MAIKKYVSKKTGITTYKVEVVKKSVNKLLTENMKHLAIMRKQNAGKLSLKHIIKT